ncbi:unnamed protein product [Nezara viridula]|uniref:Uncharacterized protein n=1 Tax=Nezara viridula TaxID=85310 RepID=A0A9P0MV29_NEZVI|nr:unnamed protein product [Nezara viridula]
MGGKPGYLHLGVLQEVSHVEFETQCQVSAERTRPPFFLNPRSHELSPQNTVGSRQRDALSERSRKEDQKTKNTQHLYDADPGGTVLE